MCIRAGHKWGHHGVEPLPGIQLDVDLIAGLGEWEVVVVIVGECKGCEFEGLIGLQRDERVIVVGAEDPRQKDRIAKDLGRPATSLGESRAESPRVRSCNRRGDRPRAGEIFKIIFLKKISQKVGLELLTIETILTPLYLKILFDFLLFFIFRLI